MHPNARPLNQNYLNRDASRDRAIQNRIRKNSNRNSREREDGDEERDEDPVEERRRLAQLRPHRLRNE